MISQLDVFELLWKTNIRRGWYGRVFANHGRLHSVAINKLASINNRASYLRVFGNKSPGLSNISQLYTWSIAGQCRVHCPKLSVSVSGLSPLTGRALSSKNRGCVGTMMYGQQERENISIRLVVSRNQQCHWHINDIMIKNMKVVEDKQIYK